MRLRRGVAALAMMAAATSALAGCSGSDDDGIDVEPTSEAEPTSEDGLTAEEQEAVDTVETYLEALYARGTDPIAESIDGLITDEFAADLVPGEETIEADGNKRLGPYEFALDTVTVDGDEAQVVGCLDLSLSFVVPAEDTEVSGGAPVGGRSVTTYGLERVDDAWRVAYPLSEGEEC